MSQPTLRPMDYRDLLDEMFDLYKRKFVLFVGICAVVFVPVYLLAYLLAGQGGDKLASVLSLPLNLAATAAMTWAVSQSYLGRDVTILGSYNAIKSNLMAFIGTMVVASLIIMGGFILLIIPGIIFAFRLAFISQVYVVEGKAYGEGRSRSKCLADGQWGRIFVLGLLASVLTIIVTWIIAIPGGFIAGIFGASEFGSPVGAAFLGIVESVAMSVASPIQIILFVLLYYDIRIRKEGFDIEMLAENLEKSSALEQTPQSGVGV